MTVATLWRPTSPCGTHCLPQAASLPQVGVARIAGRMLALVAVVMVATLTLPVWPVVPTSGRPRLTRALARAALAAVGVRHGSAGRLPRRTALLVANHVSWLDALVLLAHSPARLVAKREVRRWPVVGVMATATGALFVDRSRPRGLPTTVAEVDAALRAGAVVAAFAEGTTWCGRTSGPYRPALFQAAANTGAQIVPVSLRFRLADGSATTVAAFLGDDSLARSLLRVAGTRGLRVDLRAHPALHPEPGACRRALARAAGCAVAPSPGRPDGDDPGCLAPGSVSPHAHWVRAFP